MIKNNVKKLLNFQNISIFNGFRRCYFYLEPLKTVNENTNEC